MDFFNILNIKWKLIIMLIIVPKKILLLIHQNIFMVTCNFFFIRNNEPSTLPCLHPNVLPLLGGDNQGNYGVMHKVWIERFNHIPSMIELARKTHPRWMISKKHGNNGQWKLWHAYVNIQMSSNSLLSTKKP